MKQLQILLNEGKLRRHKTSAGQVNEIFKIVDRDLQDASVQIISPDRRFATAYNACLQLATVALYAAGYRTAGAGHHWITFQVLPEIMGPEAESRAKYFDSCRTKRNVTDYDSAWTISDTEADELLREANSFKSDMIEWLKSDYPNLI